MGPTYSSAKEEGSLEGVMYPGQVIRSALYGGPLGRLRTRDTLFDCVIVHEGFPWIKCCSLQTHRSQRTRSFCLMSTMGDKSVRTLIWIRATLDVIPLARRLHVEKESGTNGGGEGDNSWGGGTSNTTHLVADILEWTLRGWWDILGEEEMQEVWMLGPRCWDYLTGKEVSSSHWSGIPPLS